MLRERFRLSLPLTPRQFLPLAVGMSAMLLRIGTLNAATIVNVTGTLKDGSDTDPACPVYSEYGVDSDADGDLESVWYKGGAGTLNPVGAGGPERGDLTGTGGFRPLPGRRIFTPAGTPVTLANIRAIL